MPSLTTPIGRLTVAATDRGLRAVFFADEQPVPSPQDVRGGEHEHAALLALEAYFAGERDPFASLALDLAGTPFQRAVWDALRQVPAGQTTTYTALAHAVGRPAAVRAVGAAVGRTPVPPVVPCHRALGSDGSLTGYRGGLERKRTLLDHERGVAALALA